MRWLSAVLIVASAGCNRLLDHEGAELVGSLDDSDGDGVIDERDNCPDPNPDQVDTDRDGMGDACDSCPMDRPTRDRDGDEIDDACDSCLLGPEVDDDGDGTMDACDLCPITPTDTQRDLDGDLIGDGCDQPNMALNSHAIVDTFATLEDHWGGLAQWSHDPSTTSLVATTATASLAPMIEAFPVSTTVAYDIPGDGWVAISQGNLVCRASCSAGGCAMELVNAGVMLPRIDVPPGPGVLRFSQRADQAGGPAQLPTFECGSLDSSRVTQDVTSSEAGLLLEASVGVRITGVDLVQ